MSKRIIESPMYTVPEAAKYLKLNIYVTRDLIHYGFLHVINLGRTKISRQEMDRFIDKWTGKDLAGELDAKKNPAEDDPAEKRIVI